MTIAGNPSTKHSMFVVPCTLDPTYPASDVLTTNPAGTATDPIVSTDGGASWTTTRVITTSADASAGVDVTAAPGALLKIVVDDLLISTDTALNLIFKEETSATVIRGPIYMAANSTTQITLRDKTKLPVANKKLRVFASVAGNIMIEVLHHTEA